jgi:hypothetical protein
LRGVQASLGDSAAAEALLDVVLDDLVELAAMLSPRSVIAFWPSMKTGAAGASPGAGQADADVGMLALAGPLTMQPITATFIFSTPGYFARHTGICARRKSSICLASSWKVVLVVRPQPGAGGDARHEAAQAQGLQDLGGDHDFLRARFAGCGVSETRIVSPMPSCSRMPSATEEATVPLVAHAGLGQAQVQRVVAAARQLAVDRRSGPARR